jgi:CheY-like chemotaxis protein
MRPNSINHDPQALADLLNRLEEPSVKAEAGFKRDFVRWPFRKLAVGLGIVHPGGNMSTIRAACRNLSNGGVCLLHSSYVHAGSECVVTLTHPMRGEVKVPGKVVRCMHRTGVIHELGVKFNAPIDAKEFVIPDPFSNSFSVESVRPQELKGRVLLVEPAPAEREKFGVYIRETCLSLVAAESLADGIVKCDAIDLVVMASQLPDSEPAAAVQRLRSAGCKAPILVVVPDASEATRQHVGRVEAAAFVVRPFSEEVMLRAIADVLLAGARPVRRAA